MNARTFSALAGAALFLSGCGATLVRTPPGTSVELALAKKADVVRLADSGPADAVSSGASEPGPTSYREVYVPPVEPTLPTNDRIEAVADLFTRGKEALEADQNDEAVKMFEAATNADATFTEAWEYLAVAYQRVGQSEKAVAAFQKSKGLAQH